jgi:hypothetical protein
MNRVWAYTISKPLNVADTDVLLQSGQNFAKGWTAHDQQLTASFEIFKNKIIVVKVNEEVTGASGCSIDKLTRFVKETEQSFNIELMNRLLVAYKQGDDLEITHSSKVKDLLANGTMNENTVIYNTSLANEEELKNWEQPLKNTWLNKYL